MAEIDPRIILGAQQPNYLQGVGQTANVANALLGAQAQRQQIQANLATSDAFKQATNPETGQTDWNQLRGLVAQGPAAYNLPQINQAITQNQVAQQTLEAGRFELAMKKQQALNDQLGALANLGPNVTANDVTQRMVDLVQSGVLPTEVAVSELGKMPKDANGLQQWIKQHQFTALKGMERLQAMNPDIIPVQTGAGTVLINKNMMSAAPYGVIGNVKQELSPGQLTETVNIVGPDGEPRSITKQQWLQMQGGGGGAAPSGGEGGYTGRYNAQPSAPGVQTGLSPGQQRTQAAASDMASQLSANAETSPTRISILKQAQSALANPSLQTGPNTDWRNQAKSFLNAVAPEISKAVGSAENIKDYDEFVKLMNQYANQASANMGTGTNDRLNIALMGNANPHISKMANQDILAKTIAVEKMNQAKNYAWQNANVDPGKYQQWSSQWNKNVSPEVFIADELSKEQQAKMFSKMSAAELTKFKNAYANAFKAGLVGQ